MKNITCTPQKEKQKGLFVVIDEKHRERVGKYAAYYSEEENRFSDGALIVKTFKSISEAEQYIEQNKDNFNGIDYKIIPQNEHFTSTSRLYNELGNEIG